MLLLVYAKRVVELPGRKLHLGEQKNHLSSACSCTDSIYAFKISLATGPRWCTGGARGRSAEGTGRPLLYTIALRPGHGHS